MTIAIVGSVIANKPQNGGNAWAVLNWVLGLRRLGVDAYLVEQITPEACVDENGVRTSFERSINRAYFETVTEQSGLRGRAALLGGESSFGMSHEEVRRLAVDTDLLINISGHLTLDAVRYGPRCRVYLDFDPGFTQIWHAAGLLDLRESDHDLYYTVGGNVGTPDCPLPLGGIEWRTVAQPVVIEEGDRPVIDRDRFTTVASWRGPFGPVEFQGSVLGVKAHEFRKVMDLPWQAPGEFELALDIYPGDVHDREMLEASGWRLADPRQVAGDPSEFDRYVRGSRAEFSAAQGVYAHTNSGWFSDRSARYLAYGRPALVQDTGFGRWLPTGEGVLPWRTLDDAVRAAAAINTEYAAHSRAARALAQKHFDAERVLGRFLDETERSPIHAGTRGKETHVYS